MNKIISMIEDLAETIIKSYDMKGGDPLTKDGAVKCMGNSTEKHNRIDPITNEVIEEEYYIDPIDDGVIQTENYLQTPIQKGCYKTSNLCTWLQTQANDYRPLTSPLGREDITDDWFLEHCPNAIPRGLRPPPATYTTGGPSILNPPTVLAVMMNGTIQCWATYVMSQDLGSAQPTEVAMYAGMVGIFAFTWYEMYQTIYGNRPFR